MKKILLILIFLMPLTLVPNFTPSRASTTSSYTVTTSNQCSNPTESIGVEVNGLLYNVTQINLASNECVNITLVNADPDIVHTFTIDSNMAMNVTYFNIFAKNGTTVSRDFWTPNGNYKVIFYCAVPGHETAGQFGYITFGLSTGKSGPINYYYKTPSQCSTSSMNVFVTAGPGESYNVSTITVPTDTCVNITVHNADTIDHTFTIDSQPHYNISLLNIYLTSSQTNSSNFLTPTTNMKLTYYCAIPGHNAAGQFGTMIIGTGTTTTSTNQNSSSNTSSSQQSVTSPISKSTVSTTPGFDTTSIISMFLIIDFIMILRKKNKRKR